MYGYAGSTWVYKGFGPSTSNAYQLTPVFIVEIKVIE